MQFFYPLNYSKNISSLDAYWLLFKTAIFTVKNGWQISKPETHQYYSNSILYHLLFSITQSIFLKDNVQ